MRSTCLLFLFFAAFTSDAQLIDSLNTAKNCSYMNKEEKEMIYEINHVRSNPRSYLQYINPLLEKAEKTLKENGKGGKNYSLTFTTTTVNGKSQQEIDTTWHYMNEEEVKALRTLTDDLKKLKSLSVLLPDSGIYRAAKKHAVDQHKHDWNLMHTGSDGSDPWDRITKFSPSMSFGNENIAAQSGSPTPREIVIQLLVDSGIPGYGHRYNLLDPQWTHVACTGEKYKDFMYWWIQNFGVKKKK
jgi:uncharacterized protein YkwD